VLTLVAILGWPWSVAFSALESTRERQDEGQRQGQHKPTLEGRCSVSSNRWDSTCPPALPLVFDTSQDEEDDDSSPLQAGFFLAIGLEGPRPRVVSCQWLPVSRGSNDHPATRLCHLRC
jgi:hypothetical protein